MGQANNRGTREERVQAAIARDQALQKAHEEAERQKKEEWERVIQEARKNNTPVTVQARARSGKSSLLVASALAMAGVGLIQK